jgi:hypothetical protein
MATLMSPKHTETHRFSLFPDWVSESRIRRTLNDRERHQSMEDEK